MGAGARREPRGRVGAGGGMGTADDSGGASFWILGVGMYHKHFLCFFPSSVYSFCLFGIGISFCFLSLSFGGVIIVRFLPFFSLFLFLFPFPLFSYRDFLCFSFFHILIYFILYVVGVVAGIFSFIFTIVWIPAG